MPDEGDIVLDWESTMSGSLTDAEGTSTLTIVQVIERLSNDLESGAEDPHYGLAAVLQREPEKSEKRAARDITVGALAGIGAALGKGGLGL